MPFLRSLAIKYSELLSSLIFVLEIFSLQAGKGRILKDLASDLPIKFT